MNGPRLGTQRGMLAALSVALVLTIVTVSGPTAASRSIAGTALPAGVVSDAGVAATSGTPSTEAAPSPAPRQPPSRYFVKLEDHPLLVGGIALPELTCSLPRFGRDESRLRAYYLALRECVDTGWRTALTEAGLKWSSPTMNLASNPGEVFCGDFDEEDFTAAYCPDSEMIFLPVDRVTKVDRGSPAVHLGVFAHEYAHHVQATVGILEAAYQREDHVGRDSDDGQELSRRTELQADCFAGLFLAAAAGRGDISRQLAEAAINTFRYGALARTHGAGSRQFAWARAGFQGQNTAACNTWAAPADQVR